MAAQIIFLHGPSSSGKSTLAQAVQAQIEAPFWHVSIDHLRDAQILPTARYRSNEFDWKADRAAFFDGFHRSLGAYAAAGNNLIIEHILDMPGGLEQLREILVPYDVFFVGLHCGLDELNARELARGDRPVGSAEADFHQVHQGRVYDLELSGEDNLQGNVDRLLQAWRLPERRGDFSAG